MEHGCVITYRTTFQRVSGFRRDGVDDEMDMMHHLDQDCQVLPALPGLKL